MTAVGTVANQIGLRDIGDSRAVLMAMVGGKTRHAYAADAANVDIETMGDALYHASGLFVDGSIKGNTGRSRDNLTHVLWLPFDVDLLDFIGSSTDDEGKQQRAQLLAELGEASQSEIDEAIAGLRTDVEATFAALKLPIHRLDYTGYGLCAYIYLDERDQTRVDDAQDAHKFLIKRINEYYGDRLVDPACSDAGTRVTRIPESHNLKGSIPRLVQSLIPYTGETAPLGHNPAAPRSVARMIPTTGDGLSEQDARAFVDAIAPSWSRGQRHFVALAVAGMLAKAGIPEEQAVAIIQALSHTDGDVWTQTITEVQTTYRRARQGSDIAGFTKLREIIPVTALQFVDAMLERYRPTASVAAGSVSIGMFDVVGGRIAEGVRQARGDRSLDDIDRNKRISDLFPLPPEAAYFGTFGEWKQLMSPSSEAPEAFHLGASLTVFGAMMSRRVSATYNSEPLYGNLFTALIGSTGKTRKDTAIKRVLHAAQRVEGMRIIIPGYHVSRDVSSAEGLVNTLKTNPNTIFYLSELSHLQKNAQRKGTRTIMDRLIEAWDTPAILENLSKGNPLQAHNPFLSIIAATQPTRLADNMTDEDIESGFANRWLFIFGKPRPKMPRTPDVDWRAAWKLYCGWYDAINSYAEGSTLRWDGSADELWDSWYLDDTRDNGDDEEAMAIRHPVLAQKVALIFAVSERSPVIALRHVEAAIALIDWMWQVVRELMRGWGVGIESQIEIVIVQTLKRFGPMYRRHLQQKCSRRRWSGRDFANVFRAMQENGQVTIDPTGIVTLVDS